MSPVLFLIDCLSHSYTIITIITLHVHIIETKGFVVARPVQSLFDRNHQAIFPYFQPKPFRPLYHQAVRRTSTVPNRRASPLCIKRLLFRHTGHGFNSQRFLKCACYNVLFDSLLFPHVVHVFVLVQSHLAIENTVICLLSAVGCLSSSAS